MYYLLLTVQWIEFYYDLYVVPCCLFSQVNKVLWYFTFKCLGLKLVTYKLWRRSISKRPPRSNDRQRSKFKFKHEVNTWIARYKICNSGHQLQIIYIALLVLSLHKVGIWMSNEVKKNNQKFKKNHVVKCRNNKE